MNQDKKIWTFTTVKNEDDIIETFVRYNINIVDGMVISDNGSSDNTLNILNSLKKEGYNLIILKDENMYFDQVKIRNFLLDYTFKNTNADIVIPLDSDEFISSDTKENPRELLQELELNNIYLYKLINYILDSKTTNIGEFNLEKFNYRRETVEEDGCNYKCIIPRNVYNKGISLAMGSHNIVSDKRIKYCNLDKIYLSHYPVRSKEQITNKVIAGRLYNSSLHSRDEGLGFHQYEILDEIIKNNELTDKTLIKISKQYSLKNKSSKLKIRKKSIYTGFCKNLKLKYTKNNSSKMVLSNTLKVSENIINEMREKYIIISNEYSKSLDVVSNLKKINEVHENEINFLKKKNEELVKMYEIEKNKVTNIQNSTSWKVTKPLRKVSSIIKGNKK